jgi:hypothetical protein
MIFKEIFALSAAWGRLALDHPDDSRLLLGGIARRVRNSVSYQHRVRFFRLCFRRFVRLANGGRPK